MRAWYFTPPLLLVLALGIHGCGTDNAQVAAPASAVGTQQPDDPTHPTAMQLHDLAGQLILFQVETGKWPAKLSQLDKRMGGKPAGIDPTSGQPYVYMPDGPRRDKLPGRLVVCQATPQPSGGRWCLLINDYGHEGQVLTYVQRVDESVFERLKTGGGW